MKKRLFTFIMTAAPLLCLPLLGAWIAGFPISRYFEFPPRTIYIETAPFSRIHFIAYALIFLGMLAPMLIKGTLFYKSSKKRALLYSFPWWGWFAAILNMISWVLAWSRFSWFESAQPHTFCFLWFPFIIVANALCYARDGRSMLTHQTVFFLALFPASAVFWWFFEYLNRFVQNWLYAGSDLGPWTYFGYATLSFSTVLPAVLTVRDWICGTQWIQSGFGNWVRIRSFSSSRQAWFFLILFSAGLAGIGVWPNFLFPLLWASPLFMITSVQALMKERHLFSGIQRGDWREIVSAAIAALICGWFWEMWNYYSLTRWEYRIPYVHRFQIFEMPVLGYAGYLPFGLECAIIGNLMQQSMARFRRGSS
ncbi:MAG: hypothetical protein A2V65_02285 [Deltaproteobacteria bacterium RBG_13_49_15]|nr:MAG: hypothetical protein A2V65_02285 [Deltaproteobacteria bacterium RBG_13_49_15]